MLDNLHAIQKLVFNTCGFDYTTPVQENESTAYGAYTFKLNNSTVRFRSSKITPTKVGQFVTLWKRIGKGPIQPFDSADSNDLYIISVRKTNLFGHFVFPKSVLFAQSILSNKGIGGKRAMRVYPPWDKTTNAQAQKSQKWQLNYFLEIPENGSLDIIRAKILYNV